MNFNQPPWCIYYTYTVHFRRIIIEETNPVVTDRVTTCPVLNRTAPVWSEVSVRVKTASPVLVPVALCPLFAVPSQRIERICMLCSNSSTSSLPCGWVECHPSIFAALELGLCGLAAKPGLQMWEWAGGDGGQGCCVHETPPKYFAGRHSNIVMDITAWSLELNPNQGTICVELYVESPADHKLVVDYTVTLLCVLWKMTVWCSLMGWSAFEVTFSLL